MEKCLCTNQPLRNVEGKLLLDDELDTFFSRLNQHDASDGVSRQTRTNNQVLTVDEQL